MKSTSADVKFQTDSESYTLTQPGPWYEATIRFTFHNDLKKNVYFVNCGGATGILLEKFVDSTWKPVWSPVMTTCLSAPLIVAAGKDWRSEIRVSAAPIGSNFLPQFSVRDIPGTYRVQWTHALRSYDPSKPRFGTQLPLQQRISNSFEIKIAR